jgi:hypothetical protein
MIAMIPIPTNDDEPLSGRLGFLEPRARWLLRRIVDGGVVGLSEPARGLSSILGRRLHRRTRDALRAHFDTGTRR